MGKAIGGVPEPSALSSSGRAAPGTRAGEREPAGPAGASGAGAEAPSGIGAHLARQRRLRGLELDELARLTRLPRRSLERLEAGAFDGPPDGFSRGFVRTVAEAIGLDAEETVSRMLREPEAPERAGLAGLARPAALLAALAAGLLLVGLLARITTRAAAAPEETFAPPSAELPVRRDHVRAIAAEEGLLPSAPAPAPATSPE